jgi:phosphoribosylaminoimidazole-succinocarboxamide synthase
MFHRDLFREQLQHTLTATSLPGLGEPRRGKVRDVYREGDRLLLVTTDRLSAFDQVLTTIPFKGQLLNQLAAFWFEKTRDLAENHLIEVPDPNVLVGRRCEPLPVEVVVRGHLTGSLWRDYDAGRANSAYGLSLPVGLAKDAAFESPLVTPSTKAEGGAHDAPLSEGALLAQGLMAPEIWREVRRIALALFERGRSWAEGRGLILVDTKYEFGLDRARGDRVVLIDEIHTPDSSRYWIADGWRARQAKGEPQQMLDKENIRQWLLRERGFSGQGAPPAIPDEVRIDLALTYAEAYQRITGETPQLEVGPVEPRITEALRRRGFLK